MKKNITFPFKKIFLVSFCAFVFIYADAQRRGESHQQNNHIGRSPSASMNHGTRIQHQNPSIRNNSARPPHITSPGSGQNNFHPDRHFSNAHPNYHSNSRYNYSRRPPVYSAHNPSWRYRSLPRRNTIITAFPFSYQTINYGGYGYRYYNGCYYRPYNNAFIVVAPPLGLFIHVLPFGYRRMLINDYPYYYYNGTYYDQYQDNYRVVAPPLGAVVESIPEGYETVVIDGETYYKVDGVQYKPVVQDNGEIWYEVIKVD